MLLEVHTDIDACFQRIVYFNRITSFFSGKPLDGYNQSPCSLYGLSPHPGRHPVPPTILEAVTLFNLSH